MPIKSALAAVILALTPGFASAQCSADHEKATMSCADGTVWDDKSRACISPTG